MLRILIQPGELPLTLHQMAKGLAMGYAAKSLVGQRFEEDWSKSVEEWRRDLNVVDESLFEFRSGRSERSGSSSRDCA
jgi:ubiquinone biosynthesis protein Coq4